MDDIIDIPEPYRPQIEELPGKDMRLLAEAIEFHRPGDGVALTLLLAQRFPGIPLYMHNVRKLLVAIRDDAIRADYDAGRGTVTAKDLALKYRPISLRQIENILARPSSQAELQKRQLPLF